MADNVNKPSSKTVKFKPIKDMYSEFINDSYEFDESYKPGDYLRDPKQVRSIAEMVACLEKNKDVDIEANVLVRNKETGDIGIKKIGKKEFLKSFKEGEKNWEGVKFSKLREAGIDEFSSDTFSPSSGLIGQDFVPLLGGPFYKNMYFYDFVKQANASFFAFHHDPVAHQCVNIIKDFTLGRGYRVDCKNTAALALWRAFEKANKLQNQMDQFATEISVNGEVMFWWLPDNETKIVQDRYPGQPVPKGVIPRVRLIDATVFWEVVTEPEDITSVLYYVWVAPTQWQLYSGLDNGSMLPTSKFIFQTIPADQIMHYKVNTFSNEKRGRSDLFSVLGFLKRLRDSVNYSLVSLQKQAAWCIDTTIEGNQSDIDAYITDQQSIGTIAPAGSEFVHSAKIKREYQGVQGTGKGGGSVTFEWALSCVAAGLGIPVSYLGTHLSGGGTRASAIVATEPVAKRLEARQKIYENVIHDLWDKVMEWAGINPEDAECEVTFPEIITQDRSQKLTDLSLAVQEGWISKERAAILVAKEFNITDYEFDDEQETIDNEKQKNISDEMNNPLNPMANPLSAPPKAGPNKIGKEKDKKNGKPPKPSGSIPGKERVKVKKQNDN